MPSLFPSNSQALKAVAETAFSHLPLPLYEPCFPRPDDPTTFPGTGCRQEELRHFARLEPASQEPRILSCCLLARLRMMWHKASVCSNPHPRVPIASDSHPLLIAFNKKISCRPFHRCSEALGETLFLPGSFQVGRVAGNPAYHRSIMHDGNTWRANSIKGSLSMSLEDIRAYGLVSLIRYDGEIHTQLVL